MDNKQSINEGLRELALFAGAGGGILGGKLLGWHTVCAVEFEEYPRNVLVSRQNDGSLPPFPIWDDVRTFDGKPWRGIVDVVSGGFPCQDISAAGKGAGIEGERSGLWSEMARIIGEVRPKYAWVENSPLLIQRGLTRCLRDLAKMGYDAKWGVVGAHHAGLPHNRKRCWVLAYISNNQNKHVQKPEMVGQKRRVQVAVRRNSDVDRFSRSSWKANQPAMVGTLNGVGSWVERSKAIGNGQVPQAMKLAWEILSNE